MALVALPTELLEHICDFLPDRSDQVNLSAVCHRFSAILDKYLYREVHIKSLAQCVLFGEALARRARARHIRAFTLDTYHAVNTSGMIEEAQEQLSDDVRESSNGLSLHIKALSLFLNITKLVLHTQPVCPEVVEATLGRSSTLLALRSCRLPYAVRLHILDADMDDRFTRIST